MSINKVLAKKLFRSFLRESKSLERSSRRLWLNRSPVFEEFQRCRMLPAKRTLHQLKQVFPKKVHDLLDADLNLISSQCITGADIRTLCRYAFATHPEENIDVGFECYRILKHQEALNKMISITDTDVVVQRHTEASAAGVSVSSSSAAASAPSSPAAPVPSTSSVNSSASDLAAAGSTESAGAGAGAGARGGSVRVILSAVYNATQSQAMSEGYVYYYRVVLENNSSGPIQLLGRHWNFRSGDEVTVTVPKYADGVIGQQPVVQPGEAFEYMSRVVLNYADGGSMDGAFLMRCAAGEEEGGAAAVLVRQREKKEKEKAKGGEKKRKGKRGQEVTEVGGNAGGGEMFEVAVGKCALNPTSLVGH